MKLDDDQNGLARVDPTAANTPVPRRAVPMKRGDRPTTEDLTPASLGGTAKVKEALANALRPVFEQMDADPHSTVPSRASSATFLINRASPAIAPAMPMRASLNSS